MRALELSNQVKQTHADNGNHFCGCHVHSAMMTLVMHDAIANACKNSDVLQTLFCPIQYGHFYCPVDTSFYDVASYSYL